MTHQSKPFLSCLLALLVFSLCACKSAPPVRQTLYLSTIKGEAFLVYEIDPANGKLTELQNIELAARGGPIAVSDDGRSVYAVIGAKGDAPPRVVAMARDTKTGKLTEIGTTAVPEFPTYLDVDANNRFAITASYGPGVVHTFKIGEDHAIVEGPIQTTKTERTAHAGLIDPSNRFVYIPHTVPNAIYQFTFNDKTGKIAPIQPLVVKGGGTPQRPAGPRHYTYHPSLGIVYAVNELNSSVSAYHWDKKTGKLSRFQTLTTLPAGFALRNTCADIHITPDGRFLYASNRGHDTLAGYKLDDEGIMTFIDWFETEEMPREFAIDVTGRYLYSAGLRSHKLAAYGIDPRTGRLDRIGTYDTPEGPIWVEAVKLD